MPHRSNGPGPPASLKVKEDSIMKRQLALIAALTVALSAAPAFAKAGKFDTFSDGARASKFDPYTDGAKAGKFDTYTDGAKSGKFDTYSDGAKSFDVYSDGAKL
jgi:hypothetical protein